MNKLFYLFTFILFLAGCVSGGGDDQEADCGEFESFSTITRSCFSVFSGTAPLGTTSSVTIIEDDNSIVGDDEPDGTLITLEYTNQPSTDVATACNVDTTGAAVEVNTYDNIVLASGCECFGGVCQVRLISNPNSRDGGIISYQFDDGDGFGDWRSATVTVTAQEDSPTFCPVSLTQVDCGGFDCIGAVDASDNINADQGIDYLFDLFTFAVNPTANLYYFDNFNGACLKSDGTDWVARGAADMTGAPNGDNTQEGQCVYSELGFNTDVCAGGNCFGLVDPNTVVTVSPQVRGSVYWDSALNQCYFYDGNSWELVSTLGTYDQVVSVPESSNNQFNMLNAYDPEDGSLTIADFFTVGNLADISCLSGLCNYNTTSTTYENEFAGFDGTTLVTEITSVNMNVDELNGSLSVTDSAGNNASMNVLFLTHDINDAPSVPDITGSETEGTTYSFTFSISTANSDIQTTALAVANGAATVRIVDPDSPTVDSIVFNTSGGSECEANATGSTLSDLDDTQTADGILRCFVPGKGMAVMTFDAVPAAGQNSDFGNAQTATFEFYPFPDFGNGTSDTVTIGWQATDDDVFIATGDTALTDTGEIVLTYYNDNDAPSICNFDTATTGTPCSNQTSIACVAPEDPNNLDNVLSPASATLTNVFASTNLNFGAGDVFQIPATDIDFSGDGILANKTAGHVFYRSAGAGSDTTECYVSDNVSGWVNPATIRCPYAAANGSPATRTGSTSAAALATTVEAGDVHFVYDAAGPTYDCQVADDTGTWSAGHFYVMLSQEIIDTTAYTDATTKQANQTAFPFSTADFVDLESDTITIEYGNPVNGELTGCSGTTTLTGSSDANCTGFIPDYSFAGIGSFDIYVADPSTTATPKVYPITVAVAEVDDVPGITFASDDSRFGTTAGAALTDTSFTINEGSILQLYNFKVDESLVTDPSEDDQDISIQITSTNSAVVDPNIIEFYWDSQANKASSAKTDLNAIPGALNALGEGVGVDAASNNLMIKVPTTPGNFGTSIIAITVDDGTNQTTYNITLNVEARAAVHNGWDNFYGVGPMLRKSADPRDCNDAGEYTENTTYCTGGTGDDCTGTVNPNSDTTNFNPAVNGLVYYEANGSNVNTCYESYHDGTNGYWIPRGCAFNLADTNCGGGDCLGDGPPTKNATWGSSTPTLDGVRYADYTNNVCYISEAGVGWKPEGRYIELDWKVFTIVGTSATKYNIYRKTANEEFLYDEPFEVTSDALTTEYTDVLNDCTTAEVTAGTCTTVISSYDHEQAYRFQYLVLPVDDNDNPVFSQEAFSEIDTILPAYNQNFLPRRILNREICEKMNATVIDKSNNNRCLFNSTIQYAYLFETDGGANYVDIGDGNVNHIGTLVDRFEYGCDFQSAVTASGDCGVGEPCYGNAVNATNPSTPTAYYARDTQTCLINNVNINAVAAGVLDDQTAPVATTTLADATFKSRLGGLPPVTNVTQTEAQSACADSTAIVVSDATATISTERLPSRQEQIAFSAWDSSESDATISNTEEGLDLDASSKCNSTNADGLTTDFTDAEIPLSSFSHTLPATDSSSVKTLVTANDYTRDCESRYGIRDTVGNAREWASDTFNSGTYAGESGTINTTSDLDGDGGSQSAFTFFDDTSGPNLTGVPVDEVIANELLANFFDVALGFPIAANNGFNIGSSAGITSSALHSDKYFHDNPAGTLGLLYGGSYDPIGTDTTGAGNGRWTFELLDNSTADSATGFRCISDVTVP